MADPLSATAGGEPVASEYYRITGRLPLASRVSFRARRRMFRLFMRETAPDEGTTVLDLGVTCDARSRESNYFEQLYPYPHRVVCAGTEAAHHLESTYPGTTFVRVTPGERLPFADRQFDVVFSNAVVEHAGSRADQRQFVREALRVGRRFFLTTPNRWFPVEVHTGLPLLHYLHPGVYRGLLRRLGHEYYAREENLNLLDRRSLLALFPAGVCVRVSRVRTLGVTSNLVAHGTC
jgi:SAM-dependent methyltransferase